MNTFKRFVAGAAFSTLIFAFSARAQFVTTWEIDAGGAIADVATTTFTFTVSGYPAATTITDLNIRLAIEHTFNADLEVFLRAPDGTGVFLFTQIGGDSDNFQDTLIDDEAGTRIQFGIPPYIGSFGTEQATDDLNFFDGKDPNGTWSVEITDVGTGDVGTLYKAGEVAPWGAAAGTQLILNTSAVPEPSTYAVVFGVVALVAGQAFRRLRKAA
jgi:subtilisin-like proprotein convertase family protein